MQKLVRDTNILRRSIEGVDRRLKRAGSGWHLIVRHNAVALLTASGSWLGSALLELKRPSANHSLVKSYLAKTRASLRETKRLLVNPFLNKPHELVDAREFFSNAVESIRNSTNLNGVPVLLELHDSLDGRVPIEICRDGVRESLRVLIHNAVQATLDAGHFKSVVVRVGKDGKHVGARVVDQGVGVLEAHRTKIFAEKFSTKGKNGNGIGLLGVKDIIEQLHDGKVFWSSTEGKGSEFGFKLPLASNCVSV